jgi:hypothetical protein
MEVEFFRQHLVSPPPVHLAKIYSRNTFISILSTYPNLQESTLSSSPCPPFRNLQEILEGALPGRREHRIVSNSEQLPPEVLTTALGDQPIEDQERRFQKIVVRPEFFDVDPPDVLVLSLRSESPNYPNLSRDEPTQISRYIVEY